MANQTGKHKIYIQRSDRQIDRSPTNKPQICKRNNLAKKWTKDKHMPYKKNNIQTDS